ncbi:hypothetical protein ACNVED_03795 [Legionella sp. D16C41]|uniref:hypothetical protein n=1 Tax=Legionella sp. D16C41 TaxID=3402688 RepID=UPI003AF83069
MAKTLEELRKIINEQEAALLIKARQQQLSFKEQNELEKLQMRLIDEEGLDELPAVDILQNMYKPAPKPFEVQAIYHQIFENFAKEFGENNIHNQSLHFPNDEQNVKANKFFQQQANAGYAFLFKQSGCDNYAFSDGKGHYKMGAKADILAYCHKYSITPPALLSNTPEKHNEITAVNLGL